MTSPVLILALSLGILAGKNATTDGYVYLGHNQDLSGEAMLNIYNVPARPERSACLWFEFPGEQAADCYVNEYGVALASHPCRSREAGAPGGLVYELRDQVISRSRSAREAVQRIGALVENCGYGDSGCVFLVADRNEGWVCAVAGGSHWVAQRVADEQIAVVPDFYTIGEIDLKDTLNFLGSRDLVRYACRRGYYRPRRDGAFNFRLAYSDPQDLCEQEKTGADRLAQEFFFGEAIQGRSARFARRPGRKFHRRDLSQLLATPPIDNPQTALSTIFTFKPDTPPETGTVVFVRYPGQDAANFSQWTVFTRSPEVCHRYATADEALRKHFSDTGHFRERWPDHFYWHYTDPSLNRNVIPHDFEVYIPRQGRSEAARDPREVGDAFNDHFHVLEDPSRGLLYAFWTQGSYEAAADEHVVFSRSADRGRTWTEPRIIAGSPTLAHPLPVAAWQQPMLSRSGRLYCLWNQETTVHKHLCGVMMGRYSDDGGLTWSEPQTVPFPIRFSTDPADPSIPPTWCLWQRPLRLGQDGRYLAACSRYDGRGVARVEIWQYDNIDDDPEIRDIRISFFNTEDRAFDSGRVLSDHDYLPREGYHTEEGCLVGLPDGALFAVMRTSIGHPIWSVSRDDGRTWSRPEILRTCDGGPAILQPCSPCPIYDLSGGQARSGQYILLVHDTFDFKGITAYQNRGPLYLHEGRFVPGAHQPVWFSEGQLFSPRDSGNSFYTSYTALDGEGILWFGDQKYYLFGKRMNASTAP